jgi:hypothetical protein
LYRFYCRVEGFLFSGAIVKERDLKQMLEIDVFIWTIRRA